jgi:hypothetical protein
VAVGILAYFLIAGKNRFARGGMRRLIPIVTVSAIFVGILLLIYQPFTIAVIKRVNEAIDLVIHPNFDVQTDITVVYTFFVRALQRPWLGWGIGFDERAINPAEVFVYHLPAISEGYNRLVRLFFGAGIVGIFGFLIWQIAYIRRLLQGKEYFAYRLAMLLPVIGVYWGHDILRAVGILPIIFIVMGLGLALKKISPFSEQDATISE